MPTPARFVLIASLGALALPSVVSAAEEPGRAPYFTDRTQQVLGVDDFDFDSGWLPGSGIIQVRFSAHAGNTVYVGMDGDALYDWELAAISYSGFDDGGYWEMDLGLETSAQVRFDILGYQWTGDLLDPILYGIFQDLDFTPYLLAGADGRPAIIDSDLPVQDFLEIPLGIDLIIASGHIDIAIGGHVHAELAGDFIDAWEIEPGEDPILEPEDGGERVVEEGEWAPLAQDLYYEDLDAAARLGATLTVDLTFTIIPSVVVTLLGTDYTLAAFEIPVEVPQSRDLWLFDPVPLFFDAPLPPEPEGDDDDSADDDDDDGVGTDGGGGGDRATVAGCGCSSVDETGPGGGWVSLLLLAGAGMRRRRGARC